MNSLYNVIQISNNIPVIRIAENAISRRMVFKSAPCGITTLRMTIVNSYVVWKPMDIIIRIIVYQTKQILLMMACMYVVVLHVSIRNVAAIYLYVNR